MTNNSKAVREIVPFGDRAIEGFLLPENLWTPQTKFGISKTQSVLIAYPEHEPSQAAVKNIQILKSKVAQKLAPHGFKNIQRLSVEGQKTSVTLMYLYDLPLFLKICAKLGSETATDFLLDLAGMSLEQIFSDAFKTKFDAEDRQEYFKARSQGKIARRTLTDAIKDYLERHDELSDNYRTFVYPNVSDCLNRALFGKSAADLCKECGCAKDKLRDTFTAKELAQIDYRENYATQLVDKQDMEPLNAMKDAIAFLA